MSQKKGNYIWKAYHFWISGLGNEESLYDLYLPIPIKLDYIKWAREYNFNINSNVTISHEKDLK